MIGHIKLVSYAKGYGFITVRNQPHDIHFKTKDVVADRMVRVGDQVEVEAYRSAPGKVTARKVVLRPSAGAASGRASVPRRQQGDQRPYYAKPTHVKDTGSVAGGVFVGMIVGGILGPVGAAVGALIGAGASDRSRLLTQICLKCSGTGHVYGHNTFTYWISM